MHNCIIITFQCIFEFTMFCKVGPLIGPSIWILRIQCNCAVIIFQRHFKFSKITKGLSQFSPCLKIFWVEFYNTIETCQ